MTKTRFSGVAAGVALVASGCVCAGAHDLARQPAESASPSLDRPLTPAETALLAESFPAGGEGGASAVVTQVRPVPPQAQAFLRFMPRVRVRWDDQHLHVESDGIPSHGMMVGITAWQQQVPLPQAYSGANAWRIPLHPVPARIAVPIRGRFLRGAIAIAANGVPIFNPQNNRGEIAQEIGELDAWGGHCGRADDYHYHAAPIHLQEVLGRGLPIAWALDGYPVFGPTEPDGTIPAGLDAFSGHQGEGGGYHYHASTRYPYILGGFHGEVTERDGQVDPQPRARPIREAGTPLRGARITGFTWGEDSHHSLTYQVEGETRRIDYRTPADEASISFEFVDGAGRIRRESYPSRGRARGGPGDADHRPPRSRGVAAPSAVPSSIPGPSLP